MPGAASPEESGEVALEHVRSAMDELDMTDNEDVEFLQNFLNDPALMALMKTHDELDVDELPDAVTSDSLALFKDVLVEIDDEVNKDIRAEELRKLLTNLYVRSLLETHDDVASKTYDPLVESFVAETVSQPQGLDNRTPKAQQEAKMIGIRKAANEPLGITVVKEEGDLVVARIMSDSFIERQGLLHVGDIIKEINGQVVNTPEQMMDIVKKASYGSITLKIIPSTKSETNTPQIFVKTHFAYDPSKDTLIPCKEAGLPFSEGDILQILNMDDNSWWQAKRVTDDCRAGLIPSQALEERRKAFVRPEYDYTSKSLFCGMSSKKKKKKMYSTNKSSELDGADIMIYEEVTRLPPFQRKTLVLVGAPGVGRRSLKDLLLEHSPKTFGTAIPHTSRAPRGGEEHGINYFFSSREQMEEDIRNDKFLEHGEFHGNMYGVKLDTIRGVIQRGKICIVDCNAQSINMLKTAEFMPYIVFVAAPSIEILRNMFELGRAEGVTQKFYNERDFIRTVDESARIERQFRHYFDCIIVNDNMEETYRSLIENMETLITEPQWVPVNWVY
ncbi:protein PALS2-like isoform X2 [Tubulanus polymorphus]|uniref:protein PALS2-like isoform X2 n=1 Tax=Tubulanus polymorphus TaxID=672921 RepID=UPI003DA6125B